MDYFSNPYRQSRLIIVAITFVASIYISQSSFILFKPLVLFSMFMISCINLRECCSHKFKSVPFVILHIFAILLTIWGFVLSLDIINKSSQIIEYGTMLH